MTQSQEHRGSTGVDTGRRAGWSYRPRWTLAQRIRAAVLGRLARWAGLKIFYVYVRPVMRAQPLAGALAPGYTFQRMSESELVTFADDEALQMPRDFVRQAMARGDVCFGVLREGRLVAYRWYGLSGSTPAELGLHFHYATSGRAYGYKAFTLPEHRGRRLHLQTVKDTDAFLLARGVTHVAGYIETHNFASLRNNSRLEAAQTVGVVVTFGFFGRRLVFNSRGVLREGLSITTRP